MPEMKEVAELKKIMKKHGLSLEKVARELGISSRTVFRWIHGENKPSDLALKQLREFLEKNEESPS
jgi:transcriptional regulator with XRE-family HTH domain